MEVTTFVLFAAEAISENMSYLADSDHEKSEVASCLEQNEILMATVKRAMLDGMESNELVTITEQLMHWNVVAWADSDEFKLHSLANQYFNELPGA